MLNVLRESFKEGRFLKWVLVAVGAGLIAYLGNYFVGNSATPGGPTAWIARVNGEEIPEWRFREQARTLDTYYRNMFGENYEQIKPQLQIGRQALEALIEKELIRQDAHHIGLEASRAEIAQQIVAHPSLQDASGQFIGKDRYLRVLERNYPGGYAAFERILAEDLLEQKWTALVTQPVSVSEAALREAFRDRTEKTAIDYLLFASSEHEVDPENPPELDASELRRWYDEHLDDYRREAGRNIRYVVIDRQTTLETIEVTADEIQAQYDANQATYTHPEQRRARHILLRIDPAATDEDKQAVRQRAEALIARIRGGEDFAKLAEEESEDLVSAAAGGDLDFFGRGQMLESFEAAVFDTEVGQLAPLTETVHGFHVIEVSDSRPAGVTPLADVQDDIRRLLRFRRVDARMGEEADRLHAEMRGAEGFDPVAASEKLEVRSAFFNDSDGIPELGPSPEFLATVGALEAESLSTPLRVASGVALVVVDEVLAPAPAPYEQVESEVRAAFLDARTREAASRTAQQAFEGKATLAAVAKAAGKEVKSSGELGPAQGPPDAGGSSPELRRALFGDAVAEGNRGVVEVPAGAIVYEITARQPFDPTRFETEKSGLRDQLLADRRNRYRQSVVGQLRARDVIEYNQARLAALDQESAQS